MTAGNFYDCWNCTHNHNLLKRSVQFQHICIQMLPVIGFYKCRKFQWQIVSITDSTQCIGVWDMYLWHMLFDRGSVPVCRKMSIYTRGGFSYTGSSQPLFNRQHDFISRRCLVNGAGKNEHGSGHFSDGPIPELVETSPAHHRTHADGGRAAGPIGGHSYANLDFHTLP